MKLICISVAAQWSVDPWYPPLDAALPILLTSVVLATLSVTDAGVFKPCSSNADGYDGPSYSAPSSYTTTQMPYYSTAASYASYRSKRSACEYGTTYAPAAYGKAEYAQGRWVECSFCWNISNLIKLTELFSYQTEAPYATTPYAAATYSQPQTSYTTAAPYYTTPYATTSYYQPENNYYTTPYAATGYYTTPYAATSYSQPTYTTTPYSATSYPRYAAPTYTTTYATPLYYSQPRYNSSFGSELLHLNVLFFQLCNWSSVLLYCLLCPLLPCYFVCYYSVCWDVSSLVA